MKKEKLIEMWENFKDSVSRNRVKVLAVVGAVVVIGGSVGAYALMNNHNNADTKAKVEVVHEEVVDIDYLKYVKGLKDWTIEVGATFNPMDGVEWDEEYIVGVMCNSEKVNPKMIGEYDITYDVQTVDEDDVEIHKGCKVTVVSKEQAEKLVKEGKEVVTAEGIKNEQKAVASSITDEGVKVKSEGTNVVVKKDKDGGISGTVKVEKPCKGDSNKGDTNKPSNKPSGGNDKPSKPSGGNDKPSKPSGGNDKPSKPSGGNDDKPSKPSGGNDNNKPSGGNEDKPSKPEHKHKWEAEYTVVEHPAEYKEVKHDAEYKIVDHPAEYQDKWIIDKAAWDEQVLVKDAWDEPIYEKRSMLVCKGCGYQCNTNPEMFDHQDWHFDNEGRDYNWETKTVQVQTGTKHHEAEYKTVHHEAEGHYEKVKVKDAWSEQVLVKDAWVEKIKIKDAWTEKKVTGYHCSCGATK